MILEQWFRDQLRSSGDLLIWATKQVPQDRRFRRPPEPLGDWSALRHIFHMYYNERHIVLPRLQQWRGGAMPTTGEYQEEAAWENYQGSDTILDLFQQARLEHIELITGIEAKLWDEIRETTTGPVTLSWVVAKSLQHTSDHSNQILRIALFWDRVAAKEK